MGLLKCSPREKALRLGYKDEIFLSFDDFLKSEKSVSIDQKNLQIFSTEFYKTKNELGTNERHLKNHAIYTKTVQFEK